MTKSSGSDGGASVRGWYESLPDETRNALVRGLIGAVGGMAITGGLAASIPRDEDDRGGVLGPALAGALLGGAGSAFVPIGARMIGGGIRFRSESDAPVTARASNALARFGLRHAATAGLTGLAAVRQFDSLRALAHGIAGGAADYGRGGHGGVYGAPADVMRRHPIRRIIPVLRNKPYWEAVRRSDRDFARAGKDVKRIRAGRSRLALIPLAFLGGRILDRLIRGRG